MEFRVLGPFEAADESGQVVLAAGKQRAVLAVLLLHAGRVVPMDRLVDDLWGDSVPETATKMVQILVSQLRKRLPDGLLRTKAPGYLIELDGHSLDLVQFEQLAAEGRAALAGGRPDEAAARFREALGLWRGPALGEFEEPFMAVESQRLEEQRLACLEERIEADLALGREAELVGELDALVRRHPLRERLRGQLMLALYRSGRHAEALESYQEFRRMLADELGIEPPARLKELERRMLQQDPGIENVAAPSPGRVRAAAAPLLRPSSAAAPPGRKRELDGLERVFGEALAGERRLVFLSGEPGIGKTTVVDAFLAMVGDTGQATAVLGQCVEHRGAGEPYLPMLEALARLVRIVGQELVTLLAHRAPTWVAQMPWLLDDDELEAVQRRLVGATHERMLREMLEALEDITRDTALVLVLEDLHWSDASTVDLLNALARRREPARLLVIGTYRRGDAVASDHPIHRLQQELRGRGLCAEIAVGPLDQEAVEAFVADRVGVEAPRDVAAVLRERTGGNPLFATTLLDSWLERGLLDGGRPDLARLSGDVPETLRGLIEQMHEQLDRDDRELLAAASAVGQEFSAALVAAAVGRPTADVDARCEELVRVGRFVEHAGEERWPDGTVAARCRFTHDLHREVLYGRLPMRQRAEMHERIGLRLERAYAGHAKEVAARLAEHFVRAGDAARAVEALTLAAEQAFERLAHREALEHLTAGLEMLGRLEEPERWSREFALQSMLGGAQIAVGGWSADAAEAAFVRALELAERIGRQDDVGVALFRLGTLYEVRGEYERSEALMQKALVLAGSAAGSGRLVEPHELMACTLFHQGDFEDSLAHADRGLAVYDGEYFNPVTAAYGEHAGAACHSWAALSLWFLGYPDRARSRARDGVAVASDIRHRHGYAAALAYAALVEQCRLDPVETRSTAEAAIEAATQDGYPYRLAMATVLHGWALAAEGSFERGIDELERGFELSRSTGAHMDDPYYLFLLAEAYLRAGRLDAASSAVEAGLGQVTSGRPIFVEGELHRVAGEILLGLDRPDEAEVRMREALRLARDRKSPSLELRAALTLAGHLHRGGQGEEARALTARALAPFTEGFETHDLVAARELLERLDAT